MTTTRPGICDILFHRVCDAEDLFLFWFENCINKAVFVFCILHTDAAIVFLAAVSVFTVGVLLQPRVCARVLHVQRVET